MSKEVKLLLGLDLKCFVDVEGVVLVTGPDLKCLVDVKRSNVGDGT